MATYSTLEEIKSGMQDDLFADDLITLRSEQRDAIDQAKERFCKRSGRRGEYQYEVLPEFRQFLWNAKMRFGKTICAMQLMRELDVKRTLIITHRPVRLLRRMKDMVSSRSVTSPPVISALSSASMLPPAFVLPFHLVQNTRLWRNGHSSAISKPA